jgi:hypothetical protein
MEPAMSDKSIVAMATASTDKFGSRCRPRSTRRDRAAAEVVTLAATPPFPIAWRLGWVPELQLQALGHDREWLANQKCALYSKEKK